MINLGSMNRMNSVKNPFNVIVSRITIPTEFTVGIVMYGNMFDPLFDRSRIGLSNLNLTLDGDIRWESLDGFNSIFVSISSVEL